jgi:hypothetical protein
MTRALLAVLLLAGACKGKSAPTPDTKSTDPHARLGSGSAAPVEVDWNACEAALAKAAAAPLDARPMILIQGCRVCGDPTPILQWRTPHDKRGPSRADIEAAMLRCTAYCSADAKQRFLGTLDDARGTKSRTPWRQLGEVCKDKVSAIPDQRFSSGPLLLLDRIARAAAARGGQTQALATSVEIPLPPVTIVGTGLELPALSTMGPGGPVPDLASPTAPLTGRLQITVLGDDLYLGRMPRATLGPNGVTADLGPDGYPGKLVPLSQLATALSALATDRTQTVTLLVPHVAAAPSLVPVIQAASPVLPVYLAVTSNDAPDGWDIARPLPVALEVGGTDAITLTAQTSVQTLASALAQRAAQGAKRVGVTAQ